MKSFIALCLIFSLAINYVNADCPDTENVVWALGGGCQVFRNECYLIRANMVRKPGYTVTTKEECQKQCPQIIYSPTTGNYNGHVREFGNSCLKRVHTCRTGESKC
ncbi:uncharacterized protein LOC128258192 [Drosophila gunungcola]|uniref:uncharacterized protein LOC128258192 n=1 Tax=Drosophila gunungcola TaxID=103775 RepID=UPI0022E81189|nr:uncharacterized protein LOC128258192 [Drosophila gunungcola]